MKILAKKKYPIKLSKAATAVFGILLANTAYAASNTLAVGLELVTEPNKDAEVVLLESSNAIYSSLQSIPAEDITPQIQALLDVFSYVNSDINDDGVITAETAKAITQISPKRNGTSTVVTRKSPSTVPVKGIGKRLSALRKSTQKFAFRPTYQNSFLRTSNKPNKRDPSFLSDGLVKYNNNTDPALEAGGLLDQRLSGFVTVNGIQAKQSDTSSEAGFSGNTNQLTAGADYRMNNQTFAGAALSFVNGNIDMKQGGSLDNKSGTLLLYATRSINQNWFADATINMGKRNFEMDRSINFTLNNVSVNTSATSAPKGNFSGFSLGTGYELPSKNGHSLTLLASFNYTKSNIDAFQETGANAYTLAVDKQVITSKIVDVGIEWRQAVSMRFGVILPQVSLKWNKELQSKSDPVNAYFIADPNKTTLNFETGNQDLNYMNLLIGATFVLPKGLAGFAQFETQQYYDDYQQTMFSIGGRKEF